jgi:type II secretory pathway pseudopilin PulG
MGVLMSLLFPVAMKSVRAARVSSDLQRLKQLHLAFSLYRSDWNGDGNYGTSSRMGLPDSHDLERSAWRYVVNNAEMWKSPCGIHPDLQEFKDLTVQFVYPPCNEQVGCGEYYETHQDNSMLLIDTQCVDPSIRLRAPYELKQVVGVRLNGQAKTLQTYNSPDSVANWHDQKGE